MKRVTSVGRSEALRYVVRLLAPVAVLLAGLLALPWGGAAGAAPPPRRGGRGGGPPPLSPPPAVLRPAPGSLGPPPLRHGFPGLAAAERRPPRAERMASVPDRRAVAAAPAHGTGCRLPEPLPPDLCFSPGPVLRAPAAELGRGLPFSEERRRPQGGRRARRVANQAGAPHPRLDLSALDEADRGLRDAPTAHAHRGGSLLPRHGHRGWPRLPRVHPE